VAFYSDFNPKSESCEWPVMRRSRGLEDGRRPWCNLNSDPVPQRLKHVLKQI